LIADLVVQRPLSLQQPLGMNLGDPIHEGRPKAMHRVAQGQLLAEQRAPFTTLGENGATSVASPWWAAVMADPVLCWATSGLRRRPVGRS
jgi:hypothetical protein